MKAGYLKLNQSSQSYVNYGSNLIRLSQNWIIFRWLRLEYVLIAKFSYIVQKNTFLLIFVLQMWSKLGVLEL